MSMRKIYRKIAKDNNTSVAEVKKEMQSAITHAYANPNKTISMIVKQSKISSRGEIPTIEEFVSQVAKQVKEIE